MPRTSLLSTKNVVLEIQKDGVGRNSRYILDLDNQNPVGLTGYSKPFGGLERNYYIHPATREYRPRPVRRTLPDPITFELSMALQAIGYVERNLDESSRFCLYVRFVTGTQEPELPTDYSRVHVLTDVALEEMGYSDLVETGENEEADITLTLPCNAADQEVIWPCGGESVSHSLSEADDCEWLCIAQDADGNQYIGTEADGVGGAPFVIKRTMADDGTFTNTETEITALSADIDDIVVAGTSVIWASGTTISKADRGDLSSTVDYTASGAVAALIPIDAARVLAVGASGGAWLTEDGGGSWSALSTGSGENLTCGIAKTTDEWYVGGENGELLKYSGGTWSTITTPSAISAVTINSIAIPDSPAGFTREDDLFIACANATIYRKWVDDDDTVSGSWSEVGYSLSASGEATYIEFAGFMGQTLWIIHTAAGGASTVLRDWSGGYGGDNNVEVVVSTTSPSNEGYNELLVINPNKVYAVGEVPTSGNGILTLVDPN